MRSYAGNITQNMAKISFIKGSMVVIEVEGVKCFQISNQKNTIATSALFSILFYCDLTLAGNVTMENSDL